MEDNSHAGQGPVLIDIGGSVGALVVTMPATLLGDEIEIRPVGHQAEHVHGDGHVHDHHHDDGAHDHAGHHLPHVAVVNRPRDGRDGELVPSLVFGEVEEGSYELYVRPAGPVQLTVDVRGAEVTYAQWPA